MPDQSQNAVLKATLDRIERKLDRIKRNLDLVLGGKVDALSEQLEQSRKKLAAATENAAGAEAAAKDKPLEGSRRKS